MVFYYFQRIKVLERVISDFIWSKREEIRVSTPGRLSPRLFQGTSVDSA